MILAPEMAKKTESTAINELIGLERTRGPSVRDPGADLFAPPSRKKPVAADMFTLTKKPPRARTAARASTDDVAPLPRARVPIGTQPNPLVAPRLGTAMPSRPTTIPPVSDFGAPAALQTPVELAVEEDHIEVEAPAMSQPIRSVRPVSIASKFDEPAWHDDSRIVDRPVFENTSKVHARIAPAATAGLARKIALPAVLMIALGGALGGYLALRGKQPDVPRSSAAAAPRALASAREMTVAPTAAPVGGKAVTALVDVRIDSVPMGATVTLVDDGKMTFLGTTPLAASVDPARTYDVVFSYGSAPTRTETLDPRAQPKLSVTLDVKPVARPPARPAVAIAAPPRAAETTAPTAVPTPVAAPVGEGVLMISSKPPSEILVDGQPTGLMTPQRAMLLPAGTHEITLITPDRSAKRTVVVDISPDKPTKVLQDLLAP